MQDHSTSHNSDFQKPLPGGETTKEQINEVLYATKTIHKPLPGITPSPNIDDVCYRVQQKVDCDEVYPGIFIGNAATAKKKKYLKMIGVTHLLNTAEGNRYGFVNTNRLSYADTSIKYLGLPLADLPTENISRYFYTAAEFIEDALSSGGKVFVHCLMGVSRSATCVIAYLMIKKGMLAVDAIRIVRENREIHPNYGFQGQLARLDNYLRRERL